MHLGLWEWLLIPWPFIGAGLFFWILARQRAARRGSDRPSEDTGPPSTPAERD